LVRIIEKGRRMPAASRIFPGPPPGAELVPCQYVSPEGLIEGDPEEREYLYLASRDGTFSVGVWEAQPYAERIDSYVGDEFCYVIRGQVTLTGTDGSAQTFVQGDSFTMEAGWAGEWRVDKPFMKYFALSAPRSGPVSTAVEAG
jgi:uncharacterized cupin superfamily protein